METLFTESSPVYGCSSLFIRIKKKSFMKDQYSHFENTPSPRRRRQPLISKKSNSRHQPVGDYGVDVYGRKFSKYGKPLGRPTHNLEYVLTSFQISFIVAILLTDGWLAKGKAYANPSVGLQICKRNKELVDYFVEILQDFVTAEPLLRLKGALRSGDKLFEHYQIRTVAHPQFQQFIQAFGGHGTNKRVPSVSYLMQVFTWDSVAVLFMCDGSRKGQGRGMELHLQSFIGFKPCGRVSIVLYQKFGIKAFPSYYGKSSSGEDQYHIQISGFRLPIIRKKVLPLMLPTFQYKVPVPGSC
jgi:hypothetical protein